MTAPTNEELLPCPFCGAKADWAATEGGADDAWELQCQNQACPVLIVCAGPSADAAVAKWNTRAARLSESTKRVLIVDDNATLGKELAKRLSESGDQAMRCRNGPCECTPEQEANCAYKTPPTLSDEARDTLWCEAIIATQETRDGRLVCDVENLLVYFNTQRAALKGERT